MAIVHSHQNLETYNDFIRPSRLYATGGRWSGSEGRRKKRFIALIPLSRYIEKEDKDVVSYLNKVTFIPHETIKPVRTRHRDSQRLPVSKVQRTADKPDIYATELSPWSGMCSLVRPARSPDSH
jgi:hypothetical protein